MIHLQALEYVATFIGSVILICFGIGVIGVVTLVIFKMVLYFIKEVRDG